MLDGNLNLLFTIAAASITAFLGFLVFLHNRKGISNRLFIIHASIGVIWAIVNYFSVVAEPATALFLIRLVLFFAVPHVFLFLLFVLNFPAEQIQNKKLFTILLALLVFMTGLTMAPGVFKGIEVTGNGIIPIPGNLIKFFSPLLVLIFLWSAALVFKRYFKTEGTVKKQWLVIGLGFLIAYTLLIFFVFVRVITLNDTAFVPYSPLFLLPIFIGTAYAILRHHLFSIKVVAAETLTFLLLLASIVEIIIATSTLARVLGIAVVLFVFFFGTQLIRSVLREVQQREQLQALTTQLAITNEKLKELDKQKDEFLSFASHDLKSPVSKMKQWASLIYDKTYNEPQQILDTAFKIKTTGDRAIRLVDEFLNIRKLEEGKMEYNFDSKDIVEFTRGVVNDFMPIAKQKGLELNFHTSAPAILVSLDALKMRQVLENLIDNSLKYTEAGFIHVTLTEEQKSVLISINDSGGGMDPIIIPTLFEQFHREASVTKQIQGTGLGLYIAKQIMIAHRGEVWAESDGKGKGSTFHVRIAKA